MRIQRSSSSVSPKLRQISSKGHLAFSRYCPRVSWTFGASHMRCGTGGLRPNRLKLIHRDVRSPAERAWSITTEIAEHQQLGTAPPFDSSGSLDKDQRRMVLQKWKARLWVEPRFGWDWASHPQCVYFTTRKSLVTLNTSGTMLAAIVARFLSPSLFT